jgi:CheY-like chemotaxis protein
VHVESTRGGSVLVVDDNPDVADVSTGMLEQLGYQVHQARDAASALAAIDTHAFDLVVSDIVMPGTMDGVALARAMRERHPLLPVLLVTGYSQAAAEATPEFPVMRKPFQLAGVEPSGRAHDRRIQTTGDHQCGAPAQARDQ